MLFYKIKIYSDLSKIHFQINKSILRKKISNNDLSNFEVSKRIFFKTKNLFQINENDNIYSEKDNRSKRSIRIHKTNIHKGKIFLFKIIN